MAGPEVRNFTQIKRSAQVMMSFFEGFALAIEPKGSGVKEGVRTVDVARANSGERPTAMITSRIAAVGVVKAIDPESRTVTLEGVTKTLELEAVESLLRP